MYAVWYFEVCKSADGPPLIGRRLSTVQLLNHVQLYTIFANKHAHAVCVLAVPPQTLTEHCGTLTLAAPSWYDFQPCSAVNQPLQTYSVYSSRAAATLTEHDGMLTLAAPA